MHLLQCALALNHLHFEQALLRAQADVDKKQSQIDLKQKSLSALQKEDNAAASSPLEAELIRLKEERDALTKFCNEAKAAWLKHQAELIAVAQKKSATGEKVSLFTCLC